MSAVSGFLSTQQATSNDLVGEWMDEILVRQGKSANMGATLFGLMSRLPAEEADNITYNWWERDPVRRNFYTNGGNLGSGDTVLTFDDGAGNAVYPLLDVNAVLHNNRTGERVRVSVQPSASTVTVVRAFMGTNGSATTAAAITDNDVWTLVTLAKDEGADPVRGFYDQPTSYANYIQTFNKTVSLANAFKAGVLRTDKEGPKNQLVSQALENTCNDIEIALFFGSKNTVSGTNGLVYYTGGIQAGLDTAAAADTNLAANVLNGLTTSGVSLATVQTWFQAFMTNGSDTKIAFCGPKAYAAISNFANTAAGGFRIMNNEGNVFGMNLTEIQTPFGAISLCMHPLFKNITLYNDFMVVVDLKLTKQKVMEPLFYEDNIQLPGQDSYKGQFRAKLGIKQQFPGAFGYAYGFQKINA